MARRSTFHRDDVVRAALTVVEADGVGALTARRVADALGASTAPVYSNYANMEELLDAVLAHGRRLVVDYCRRTWTEDAFLDMGIGFMAFALEHPQLFRAMYLESSIAPRPDSDVTQALLADLDRHPVLGSLPQNIKDEMLFQASIYTLGIATTVVTGHWPDPDLETIETWLRSLGGLLVRAAMESAGRELPPELERNIGEFVVPWRRGMGTGSEEGNDD